MTGRKPPKWWCCPVWRIDELPKEDRAKFWIAFGVSWAFVILLAVVAVVVGSAG